MNCIQLKAPCKVNYRLDVLHRRDDGYHDLRMIMQRVDICDNVTLQLSETPGIRVSCGSSEVPDGPGNIAWRAADALLKKSGRNSGIDICIEKNIPVAAGLGGGSSDAAAVLLGVNDLLDLKLSCDELMAIGVTLGADVPFFVNGRTALAQGIGERLTPIDRMPAVWLVLVNPCVPVSTAWVYQNLKLPVREQILPLPSEFGTVGDICAILSNDLEMVTIDRYPVIQEIKERLLARGAAGVLMSGSGPTVFGVFEAETAARSCADAIAAETGWFSAAAMTI